MIPKLGSQVSALDAWHLLVSVKISDLNQEGRDAVFVPIDEQLCKHERIVGHSSHFSGPPLGRRDGGGVDDELVLDLVVGSCGLQACNVGTMTHLSLSIAPKDIQILGFWQPNLSLFFVAERHE